MNGILEQNLSCKSKLISVTPEAEETMAYIARVSSEYQENESFDGLMRYCIKKGHWSVFEHASMTVEIVCPLAIAVQIIRHRTAVFSQFSGRYQDQRLIEEKDFLDRLPFYMGCYMPIHPRMQDTLNRQNSIILLPETHGDYYTMMKEIMDVNFRKVYRVAMESYGILMSEGFAKELCRFVLPQGVYTRLYMTASVRTWIHYLQVRSEVGVVQMEHIDVTKSIVPIFKNCFPNVYGAVNKAKKSKNEELESLIRELQEEVKSLRMQLSLEVGG